MAELPLIWKSIIGAKRLINKSALRSSHKNDLNKNRVSTHDHFADDELTENWIVTANLESLQPDKCPSLSLDAMHADPTAQGPYCCHGGFYRRVPGGIA